MNNTEPHRTVRVFIASPGDLAIERRAFKELVDQLNSGFADGAGVRFEALGWEDTLASTGRRPQSVINSDIDRSDIFVLAMHRRWGQSAPDAEPYSSYTEEEFHRALSKFNKAGSPEIFVFFKNIDTASMADPGPQLEKVLSFRRSLEQSRQVLYRSFRDDSEFRGEMDRHLRAFVKGVLPSPSEPREKVILPLAYIEQVESAKRDAAALVEKADAEHLQAEAERARADELALFLAEQAAKSAIDGHIENARQGFAKAAEGTTSLQILKLAWEFYFRTGDLPEAEAIVKRWQALAGTDLANPESIEAYGNLGVIRQRQNRWKEAEDIHKSALASAQSHGFQGCIADQMARLGAIFLSQSKISLAEEMHKRSLDIEEALKRKEGIARQYCNLGIIYEKKGDLDLAEEMHNKSLEIDLALDRKEGIATQYSNLGVIHELKGNLIPAMEMYNKSLEIEEKLGRKDGLARIYCNLGLVYLSLNQLKEAEEMQRKALVLFEMLNHPEGAAAAAGNLGILHLKRGALDLAKDMLSNTLDKMTTLDIKEGIAESHHYLGLVEREQGNSDVAHAHFDESRRLYAEIGMRLEVEQLDKLIADNA